MQHDAAFQQGLHCLLRFKQPSRREIHHNLENSTCDPLKSTMSSPILIVSICMGKFTRMQRVKVDKLLSERLILEKVHLIDINVPAEIDKYPSLGLTEGQRWTDTQTNINLVKMV